MAQLRRSARLHAPAVDTPAAGPLCSLPGELLSCVVEHLGLYDTVRLACVSKTLKPICEAQLSSWHSRFCAEGLPTPHTSELPQRTDVIIIGGEHAGKIGVTSPLFASNGNDVSEGLSLAGITDVEDIPKRHAVVSFWSIPRSSAVVPYRFIEIENREFYEFTIRAHKGDVSAMRTLGSCLLGPNRPPWNRPQGGVRQCLFESGFWMAAARVCGSRFAQRDHEEITQRGATGMMIRRNPIVPDFNSLAEAEAWPNWSDESESEDEDTEDDEDSDEDSDDEDSDDEVDGHDEEDEDDQHENDED